MQLQPSVSEKINTVYALMFNFAIFWWDEHNKNSQFELYQKLLTCRPYHATSHYIEWNTHKNNEEVPAK